MLRVYFILLLAIGSNAVLNDELAPAGGSSEDLDLARSRGYCDEAGIAGTGGRWDMRGCAAGVEVEVEGGRGRWKLR